MENIIISNPEKLEKLKRAISEAGIEKLHILADFDRTLTKAFADGEKVPSIISILRNGEYLTPDYAKKAYELYDKYHPIEINLQIPFEKRKRAMREWWMTHLGLIIKSGLNKKDLKKVAASGKIHFREGFKEFVDFLMRYNIPLVIMSSSGLGSDVISILLEKEGLLHSNIYIISNSFEWGKRGKVIGIRQPIIHCMNKDETTVRDFSCYEKIKNRKNVLLLGDNLEDIGMIKGFDYDNLIKIGFLNENAKENLEQYKRNYDLVILNDSSMDYINTVLREILAPT